VNPDVGFCLLISTRALRAAIIAAVVINDAALAADYELVSGVIVSRHGVRSPTAVTPPLASIAADPWPSWPVPPGYLNPARRRTGQAARRHYRNYYAGQGLLLAQGCPQPGNVFAWVDVDQRTRMAAELRRRARFISSCCAIGTPTATPCA
jgi:hypothetical protein